jgi:hypothetical protein
VGRRGPPAGFGSGQFSQPPRERGAADARELVEHLVRRAQFAMPRQVMRERHELRVQALGAAVVQHLPEPLDGAQAGRVLARSPASRSRGWLRRCRAHAADGVLAVTAGDERDLVEQSGFRRAAVRLAVPLAHGLHVLGSGTH